MELGRYLSVKCLPGMHEAPGNLHYHTCIQKQQQNKSWDVSYQEMPTFNKFVLAEVNAASHEFSVNELTLY